MKNRLLKGLLILLFLLLSVISFFYGLVLFPPIPPSIEEILPRSICFILWLFVGVLACSAIRGKKALFLLIPPFCVMVLHSGVVLYDLFRLPIATVLGGDKYLYSLMEFVFAIFVQIGLVLEIRFKWTGNAIQSLRKRYMKEKRSITD